MIFAGLCIAAVGVVVLLLAHAPGGLLPGDLVLGRGRVKVYLLFGTSLVLSLLFTVVVWLLAHLKL